MTPEETKQKLDVSLFHLRKSYQTLRHLMNRLTEAGEQELVDEVASADRILNTVYTKVQLRYSAVDREIRMGTDSSHTRSA